MDHSYKHIENWVFDMDGTLYAPLNGLEDALEEAWYQFFLNRLGYDRATVNARSQSYEKIYQGNAFYGWQVEENITFEELINVFDRVDHSVVERCEETARLLGELSGRKFIFTNAHESRMHVVLKRLGVFDRFDGFFFVRKGDDWVKPNPALYDVFMNRYQLQAKASVMVEDRHINLKPAHEKGMHTVLVHTPLPEKPTYVDEMHASITDWLRKVRG